MSRIAAILQSFLVPLVAGVLIFAAAGRWDLPYVWGVLGVLTVFGVAMVAFADEGMLRERRKPGGPNRDRAGQAVSSVMLLVHWVLAGLDAGRYRWTPIPDELRLAGLVVYAAAMAGLFWAVKANPFYSSVVRVQPDRGHHAVEAGPYRIVRHPGYAGSLLAALAGGLAVGSWLAMLPVLVFVGLFLRRTLLEDDLLRRELPGYNEYAQRVRHRLIPGVF